MAIWGELTLQKWFDGYFHVNQFVRDNIQMLLDKVVTIK